MRQELKTDKRVALYGSQKQITEAEIILIKNIPELPTLSESQARLRIQDCLDFENIKAGILFDGNSVWSKKKILRDIRRIKKHGDDCVGGLVAANAATIADFFWDIDTSGINKMCGSQGPEGSGCDDTKGKITSVMQTQSTFTDAGWDFVGETANGTEDIWDICGGRIIRSWPGRHLCWEIFSVPME